MFLNKKALYLFQINVIIIIIIIIIIEFMEFREETIKEVNSYCDTTLTSDMTFAEAVDNIDTANNFYFYVSMRRQDIIEAINNEIELAEELDLDNVYIKELGIYIAFHP